MPIDLFLTQICPFNILIQEVVVQENDFWVHPSFLANLSYLHQSVFMSYRKKVNYSLLLVCVFGFFCCSFKLV